ncbi:MAG: 4-alpha-glucanotransferase [bacterium]|nr:4-alpha-glucanotransferase [bacterium]
MVLSDSFYSTYSGEKWRRIGIKKRAGILIPLFSVHSKTSTGIGDFSDLKLLISLCKKTGNSILQILPLNYTGYDNCPYNAISSFAIDPVYISLFDFSYNDSGFSKATIKELRTEYPAGKDNRCNYMVREAKLKLLSEFFSDMLEDILGDNAFKKFSKFTNYWLDDFAIYQVLKKIHGDAPWYEWEYSFHNRDSERINKIKDTYKKEILFQKWIQYICYKQLCQVKEFAEREGILLMGDLPILPSKDSADVWSEKELFNLEFVAGAPPDMYSAYGQRWGMPILDRYVLRSNDYRYIAEKLRYLDNFFDIIRIDHVVGLFRIWVIPKDEPEENHGLNGFFIPPEENLWKANGRDILQKMIDVTDGLLCAEDLGVIPAMCTETLQELGIPGYEIQRWKKNYDTDCSFISADNYRILAVSGLSTHDTSFWVDWYKNEAGTISKDLFLMKCKLRNIDPNRIINNLFDDPSTKDRLRWKKEMSSMEKVVKALGADKEIIQDILEIHRETFDEKVKVSSLLGINKGEASGCIKKAIEFILKTLSIFSINLLPDLLCLDNRIASEISGLRINKPGSSGPQNWTFTFREPLEEILELEIISEIKEMVEESGR